MKTLSVFYIPDSKRVTDQAPPVPPVPGTVPGVLPGAGQTADPPADHPGREYHYGPA